MAKKEENDWCWVYADELPEFNVVAWSDLTEERKEND